MHGKSKVFLFASLAFVLSFSFSEASAAGNPNDGKKIFDGICSSCHGENGITDVPGIPVFSAGERMNKSDADLAKSIKSGVNNPDNPAGMAMPPYGGGPQLNDKQIADVLAYIRTLKK